MCSMAALDLLKLAPRGRFLLAWVALGLSVSSHSQVSWSVDTTQIQWGEPVQLTAEWLLTMTDLQSGVADADAWPAWTDTTNAGLEILATSQVDTLAAPLGSEADVLLTKTWTLTSWDSGFVVLTPERFGLTKPAPCFCGCSPQMWQRTPSRCLPPTLWQWNGPSWNAF